jgi:hypothetical protein
MIINVPKLVPKLYQMEIINDMTSEKKYPIIYVDAPWNTNTWSVQG